MGAARPAPGAGPGAAHLLLGLMQRGLVRAGPGAACCRAWCSTSTAGPGAAFADKADKYDNIQITPTKHIHKQI